MSNNGVFEDLASCPKDKAEDMLERLKVELELRVQEARDAEVGAKEDLALLQRCLTTVSHRCLGGGEDIPPEGEEGSPVKGEAWEEDLSKVIATLEEEGRKGTADSVRRCETLIAEIEEIESKVRSGDSPCYGDPTRKNKCDPLNIPAARRRQMATVIFACFFTGIPIFLTLYFLLWLMPFMFPFMILYHVWMVYDLLFTKWPLKTNAKFRNHIVWKWYRDYFPVRLRVEDPTAFPVVDDEGKARNYLFTVHPHGIHSFGAFVNFATNATGIDTLLPGLKINVQTLGIQFKIPFWRELVNLAGMGDASKESLRAALNGPPGNSAMLVVGGAEEALDAYPGTSDIILKKRKGFVKIAVLNGASLVPAFSFGENDVYNNLAREPAWRSRLERLQKMLGFAVPLIKGRGVFNYSWGVLPHRRQITTVIGSPIHVKKWVAKPGVPVEKDPEFQECVDKYHKQYMEDLKALYDRHKNIHGLNRSDTLRFKH